jgi:uncharacterized membrane protein
MKKIIYSIVMAVYLFVGVIASVGAINYGIDSTETFYTVIGALNIALCGYAFYRAWEKFSSQ